MVKRSLLSLSTTNKAAKLSANVNNIYIGAHVSAEGGIYNAFNNAEKIGAKAFAIFLRNQRRWDSKPLSKDVIEKFKDIASKSYIKLDKIVPHGSYLLNCGSPNSQVLEKSRQSLLKELQICEELGLKLYNFHPGSSCGEQSVEETIKNISESINLVLKKTKSVTVLIENMSNQGNTVGGKFEELRDIIELVKDHSRIGVCLDTCHAFAAGYDISTKEGYENMLKTFDEVIGLNMLKAIHLNDSKAKCGSHLDRHEDIGKGYIGLELFNILVNDSRMINIPIILETPGITTYDKQINQLYDIIKCKN